MRQLAGADRGLARGSPSGARGPPPNVLEAPSPHVCGNGSGPVSPKIRLGADSESERPTVSWVFLGS